MTHFNGFYVCYLYGDGKYRSMLISTNHCSACEISAPDISRRTLECWNAVQSDCKSRKFKLKAKIIVVIFVCTRASKLLCAQMNVNLFTRMPWCSVLVGHCGCVQQFLGGNPRQVGCAGMEIKFIHSLHSLHSHSM